MIDYFEELNKKLSNKRCNIEIVKSNILKCKMNYSFELFEFGISEETKYIYNNYKRYMLSWEEKVQNICGFINFIPYESILRENKELCELAENMDDDLIEDQNVVINDLKHWYPIFSFANGDAFCYDKRNGKVVFFEHEVFDTGVNLNGLVIADNIDILLEKWSKILFVDIYDWYEGVNEHGIDLSKPIYEKVMQINGELSV